MPERDRTAVEKAAGSEAIPDARHTSERGEQRQWRHARRHDAVEDLLELGRIGRRKRRSEEHTSELQSPCNLVCRLLLEKKKTDRQPEPTHCTDASVTPPILVI